METTNGDLRITFASFQGTKGTTAVRPDAGVDRLNGSLTFRYNRHPSGLWPTARRTRLVVVLCRRRPRPYEDFRWCRPRSPARGATLPASANTAASTWVKSAQRDSALNVSMSVSWKR